MDEWEWKELTNIRGELVKGVSLDNKSNLPRWFNGVSLILNNLRYGELTIILPDNRPFKFVGKSEGPKGCIIVKNEEFFSRLVREGENGFPESYMDGWWDTPDLLSVLDVIMMNNNEIGHSFPGGLIFRNYERLVHWWHSNSKKQAKKNIFYHYDLGNEFYAKWLDKTMTYSSAIFRTGKESLEKAQENKYKAICDSINPRPDDHILEIGCGWGGFMEYAIKKRKVKVTGLTISKAQRDFAEKRLFEAGLSERAKILLQDYRTQSGQYDGVASIEMFEAVGEKYWPVYFNCMKNLMKSGAQSTLQIITIADELFPEYRKRVDFIQKYIFPGGMLPSKKALETQIAKVGLENVGTKCFGPSYSKTLRLWHGKFNSVWDEISSGKFDSRFKRMWNFYLASCAAVFYSKTGDVIQITLKKT